MTTSTYPVIQAGQRITAALLTSMMPQTVIKPSDETVTSSTTLQNDNDLSAPVAANASYIFEIYLDFEGGTQGSSDLKLQLIGPSGTAIRYQIICGDTSGNPYVAGGQTQLTTPAAGTNGAGTFMALSMKGTVVTGSSAGTFQLQWAQHTSSGTGTIVHVGSSLMLTRVS